MLAAARVERAPTDDAPLSRGAVGGMERRCVYAPMSPALGRDRRQIWPSGPWICLAVDCPISAGSSASWAF